MAHNSCDGPNVNECHRISPPFKIENQSYADVSGVSFKEAAPIGAGKTAPARNWMEMQAMRHVTEVEQELTTSRTVELARIVVVRQTTVTSRGPRTICKDSRGRAADSRGCIHICRMIWRSRLGLGQKKR